MSPGAALNPQDGHLPRGLAVFEDREFWKPIRNEPPKVKGIWQRKLIKDHETLGQGDAAAHGSEFDARCVVRDT